MLDDTLIKSLQTHLFAEQDCHVYAVLDGASVPKLPQALWKHEPEHVCLYRGELQPDLAATAPYLVKLEALAPFAQWVLTQGWGNHWGIFALAPQAVPFRELRKHFRTFLMVNDPEGKSIYFRYYDPRVLLAYVPTCNAEDLKIIFGPLNAYCVESKDATTAVHYSLKDGLLRTQTIPLTSPVPTS